MRGNISFSGFSLWLLCRIWETYSGHDSVWQILIRGLKVVNPPNQIRCWSQKSSKEFFKSSQVEPRMSKYSRDNIRDSWGIKVKLVLLFKIPFLQHQVFINISDIHFSSPQYPHESPTCPEEEPEQERRGLTQPDARVEFYSYRFFFKFLPGWSFSLFF